MNTGRVAHLVVESGRRVFHSLSGEVVVLDLADLVLADREEVAFSASMTPVGASCFATAPHTLDDG
jgi:hypothetical protein